jgi:hypothetical protein
MQTTTSLTGSHLRTFQRIFQHPASHNLEWRNVHALLRQIAEVVEEPNGHLRVSRNGEVLVLHPAHTKDVADTDELLTLRHFLERSESIPPVTDEREVHWLLVIDHHEARLFRSELHGSVPQKILSHGTDRYFRHAQHSEEFSRGQERPDPGSYFEPVARAMADGGSILILGTGTGMASEMEQFIAWFKVHHAASASRIIGSLVVDESHLTEGQLLAKARDFYAHPPLSRP